MMPPTIEGKQLEATPQIKPANETSFMDSIIPKANAYEPTDEEIQMLIDKGYNNEEIIQAI